MESVIGVGDPSHSPAVSAALAEPRRGYTLIELLVATASASVLMVGLSGALFVSARALDADEGATALRSDADAVLARVADDLRDARRFEQLDPTAVRFRVPDRDGDGADETIAYAWSGVSGDPLTREINGGGAVELLADVRSLDFASITSTLTALDVTIEPPPPWPVLEGFNATKVDPKEDYITLTTPAGAAVGELLIATVATDNDKSGSMSAPTGWALIDLGEQAGKMSFGVWWKLVEASEPATHTWNWSGTEEAIGLMLRISNQYAGNPITAFMTNSAKSTSGDAPAATSTLDHSMALRLLGTDKDSVSTAGVTGLPGHTDVYMDEASKVSTGCGYEIVTAAGAVSAASFSLQNNTDWRALTLIIAPKQ